MQLATIGYERSTLSDFISTLLSAGIERVIDVRQVAQSRRLGFSKNALRLALAKVQIDYHHIRQLGDPKHGREAARAGNFDLFRAIFSAHMDLAASKEAVIQAVSLATEKQSALVCFERDPKNCHRTLVAERMVAVSTLQIRNLGVQPSSARRTQDGVGFSQRVAGAY